MPKYKVTMQHFTRSLGNKQVDYVITVDLTASGFSTIDDAEQYAKSSRMVRFQNVKVE